jgi:hypothetical protein
MHPTGTPSWWGAVASDPGHGPTSIVVLVVLVVVVLVVVVVVKVVVLAGSVVVVDVGAVVVVVGWHGVQHGWGLPSHWPVAKAITATNPTMMLLICSPLRFKSPGQGPMPATPPEHRPATVQRHG